MKITKETKFLIVGLGIIGGGYAEALTKAGYKVRCITKEQSDIDYALEKGIIEEGYTTVKEDTLRWADIIVFALYPEVFVEWVEKYGALIKHGTLITDVSGVKNGVVERVEALLKDGVEFISAHPMAGREGSGVYNSDAGVFRGANYIVVPTEKNSEAAIEVCKQIGEILGFGRISVLSAKEHDQMIAFLSQLTHVIAVSLMNCNSKEGLEAYTGDSFRDLTRIAKINDAMWSELFLLNKEALVEQMDSFLAEMEAFRTALLMGDEATMREKMKNSTRQRAKFDKPKAK